MHLFTVVAMNCCSGDEKASQDTFNAIAEEIVALFGLNGLDYSHLRDVVVTVLFVVHVAMVIIFLWSHCTRNK